MDAKVKNAHVWARDEYDFYVEPERATDALLMVEAPGFLNGVWDPCCGSGNILRAIKRGGGCRDYIGSDIVDRMPADLKNLFHCEMDFLAHTEETSRDIVMNPPYFRAKGTEAFIRHALKITTGDVYAFVDIRFLAGAERAEGLYREHPPSRVWIVTPRVSCPPGAYLAAGNKAGNGSSDWCWAVWDRLEPFTGTKLAWLRRTA